MSLDLTSVRAKLLWANEHAKTLNGEILAWTKSTPYKGIPKVNADSTKYSMIHSVIFPPKLERWALMSGDCFHGMRCALDHLVYAIAVHVTGNNPPPRERKWAFPIAKNPAAFPRKRDWIDPDNILGDLVWAAIEDVQPYRRRHPELPPLLGLLEDLDNADKHRLLQWATEDIVGGSITNIRRADGGPLSQPDVFVERNPKDGAEIAALTFPVPTPHVHYAFDCLLTLALRHDCGPGGTTRTDVTQIIGDLLEETATVIDELFGKIC